MPKTSGLGRGLGSLIPNKKSTTENFSPVSPVLDSREKVAELPVGKISPNPHQPRVDFDGEELNELMESIREHGIIQPLIVTKLGDGWQLIAGERRLRAAKNLGWEKVPAIVRDMNEQKKLEIALIENLQRQDLNPLETATAYLKLISEFNLTYEQLGKKVGKSASAISNTIRILKTPDQVQEAVRSGKISEGHARVLSGLPEEDQLETLDKIVAGKMSVRETERAGRDIVVKKHIRKVNFDPETRAREEKLEQALGTKVQIKKFGPSGQVIIKFFSEEELNGLMEKLS